MKKRSIFWRILALMTAMTMVSFAAFGDELSLDNGSIVINNATNYEQNGVSGTLSAPDEGFVITQSDSTTPLNASIVVAASAGTVSVTLSGVNVAPASGNGLSVGSDADVLLTLEGDNTLKGSSNKAGLSVAETGSVEITADKDSEGAWEGNLNVTGGGYAAGIGGDTGASVGTITISGGEIVAQGGTISAGIGGGCDSPDGGTIIINDGDVTGLGSAEGAGIGGGVAGSGGEIEINGGVVYAQGGANAAGIGGGNRGTDGGTVTINDGNVTALGGEHGAGIGGGTQGEGGNITINDGDVTAQGGVLGAGIGSGCDGTDGGVIKINGGSVSATGGGEGAGIGGGVTGDGGNITITDGTVIAKGGNAASGIGGGNKGDGGDITISGGDVSAQGGQNGAGIGGDQGGNGGDITISGGTVNAQAGGYAAGIGGGTQGEGGNITISSGNVTAQGGVLGAGIGGGCDSTDGGVITVSGGNITATGGAEAAGIGGGVSAAGGTITITGGSFHVQGGSYAAAIGGGNRGNGGTVVINGGTVRVKSGVQGTNFGAGANGQEGTVTISGGLVYENGIRTYPLLTKHGASSVTLRDGRTITVPTEGVSTLTLNGQQVKGRLINPLTDEDKMFTMGLALNADASAAILIITAQEEEAGEFTPRALTIESALRQACLNAGISHIALVLGGAVISASVTEMTSDSFVSGAQALNPSLHAKAMQLRLTIAPSGTLTNDTEKIKIGQMEGYVSANRFEQEDAVTQLLHVNTFASYPEDDSLLGQ